MTHKRIAQLIALQAAALLIGCRTAPLPQPAIIDLPAGMTSQQAQVAIVAGILNAHPPEEYDPLVELSEADFDRLIWRSFVGSARGRSWFPESRDGNRIVASVDTRGLYLRAAIELTADRIGISILDSRHLSQSGGRIHKRAVKWLYNLEAHIRREVGRMSFLIGRAA